MALIGPTEHNKYLHPSEAVLAVLQLRGDTADLLSVSPPQPGHIPSLGAAVQPDALQREVDRLEQLNLFCLASTFRESQS